MTLLVPMLMCVSFSIRAEEAEWKPQAAAKDPAHAALADQKGESFVREIESARAGISQAERQTREAMSHLFTINRRVKEMAKKSARLSERLVNQEANVRSLAQDVQTLERKSERHQDFLNRRLRQLYQERERKPLQWLFSAKSPAEVERNRRFLKLMIDSDHKLLKSYLVGMRELRHKRSSLKTMVKQLAKMQRDVQAQENQLFLEMREKSNLVAELKKSKEGRLNQLRDLRHQNGGLGEGLSYAFFERKGGLQPPVSGSLARQYGAYVDPEFRFRLMNKGLFYSAKSGSELKAVAVGTVSLAGPLPGYGNVVILDHGDDYHSVYTYASQLKVKTGAKVKEGDVIALSGEGSPLFGPGVYFEIRHFTDAIDPRPWIKESLIKTAKAD